MICYSITAKDRQKTSKLKTILKLLGSVLHEQYRRKKCAYEHLV